VKLRLLAAEIVLLFYQLTSVAAQVDEFRKGVLQNAPSVGIPIQKSYLYSATPGLEGRDSVVIAVLKKVRAGCRGRTSGWGRSSNTFLYQAWCVALHIKVGFWTC